jgi:hypothetical protein
VLASGATAGDLVETVSFFVSSVLNAIPAVANAVTETYINTGAVTQSKLGAGVAGNGPAFSAYKSSSQSPTSGTWTKVTFDTEEFDTNNTFASSTFTPTVAGYYQLNVSLNTGGANVAYNFIRVYKNGSAFKLPTGIQLTSSAIAEQYTTGSVLVYANGSTDYFEIYILTTAPTIYSGSATSYFQASMVRAA